MRKIITTTLLAVLVASPLCNAQNPDKTSDYVSPIHFKPTLPTKKTVGDVMPFYWEGVYHVFYLTNPLGNHDVNWEHCSSVDLVNWKEYPPALIPDHEHPEGPDGGCMFTGCIVEKDGVFHAWYTSWNPKNPEGREFLSHATSKDLITWTKHPEHRIAPDGVHYANHRIRDFRDPQIFWNDEKKEYWMHILANIPNKEGWEFGLLTSKDLVNWEQKPSVTLQDAVGDECPDYFKIGDTHYIHGCRKYYYSDKLTGPYRHPKLTREIDLPHVVAAKRVWDGKRHIWFGGWKTGGVMAMPREIYGGPEGLLYMKPVNEVLDIYTNTVLDLANKPKFVQTGSQWKYQGTVLMACESDKSSVATFDVPEHYLLDCKVKFTPNSNLAIIIGGNYQLNLNPKEGVLSLTGPGIDRTRPCPIDIAKPVKIQVFAEGKLIECFINDQFAQTCVVSSPKTRKFGINAEGSSVEILEMLVKTHLPDYQQTFAGEGK